MQEVAGYEDRRWVGMLCMCMLCFSVFLSLKDVISLDFDENQQLLD